MKTDARVRYTRMVIRQSFETLLYEKPLNCITVKEVCEKAQINRSTFYKHYLDCYNLLEKIEEELLERFEEILTSMKSNDVQATLTNFLRIIKDNAALLEKIHNHGPHDNFTHRLMNCCFKHMKQHMPPETALEHNNKQQEMLYSFLTGGAVALVVYWLQSGCLEAPEQISEKILSLIRKIIT